MLFKAQTLEAIARGEVDLAFRRWTRPTVKAGTRLRTTIGSLIIGAVDMVNPDKLTAEDAKRAGFDNIAALTRNLRDGDGTLYRIAIAGVEADERTALREEPLSQADKVALMDRLARWDKAAEYVGYHRQILRMIADHPGVVAANLAAQLGVETVKFKRDVRKLKEVGLTISLDIGYRLSPRGQDFLDGQ
ncbi:ASCH domain-containing protein [Phyllobacterium meliloti]|uniref:ASCH domain-containing protein n=1 Tax=Phyllobacterium meliloti TaxID=555317 RepID=UPI000DDC2E01|nr:ASCH domain-containing protein [Phyllobacterium sp. T1293]UGX85086.1 ASCH domain-containing protein [Phyllobacterium sp. T1293]